MAIQKCQMAGGQFLNAVEPLALNMKDEAQMADWIQTNSPGMPWHRPVKYNQLLHLHRHPHHHNHQHNHNNKMKSLVWHGPMDVRIDDKPQPIIQHPEDLILRITSTAICGSDLHLYHEQFRGCNLVKH